mgnify:CR=1 FL=1
MWDIVRGWIEQTSTLSFLLLAIIILLLAAVLSDPRAIKRLAQIVFTLFIVGFLASAYPVSYTHLTLPTKALV